MAGIAFAIIPAFAQDALRLSLPVACEPGRTCFIQHYVDIDVGPAARDFRCGSATYEGHTGVDFRLLSTAAAKRGVAVVAAAPGTVRRVRDGMADAFARTTGMTRTSEVGCGNAVVIAHGGGWETIYCHLRQGSVAVREGERVERGHRLGDVGWSGLADFAHVHLMVRKDGRVVDPFTGGGQDGACRRDDAGGGLWAEDAARAFPYRAGEILDVGFAERQPVLAALEVDHETLSPPAAGSAALLLYARVMNVREGDRIELRVTGPGGFAVDTSRMVDKSRPLQMAFVGRRLTGPAWPSGRYVGTAVLMRADTEIGRKLVELELR